MLDAADRVRPGVLTCDGPLARQPATAADPVPLSQCDPSRHRRYGRAGRGWIKRSISPNDLRRGRRERRDASVMGMRLRCPSATTVADRALHAEHAGRASSDRVRQVVDVRGEAATEEGGTCVHPNDERGGATSAGLPRERGPEPRFGDEIAPLRDRRRNGPPRESEPPSHLPPIPPRPPRGGQAANGEDLQQPQDHSERVLSSSSGTSLPEMSVERTHRGVSPRCVPGSGDVSASTDGRSSPRRWMFRE
jgi:hypothetical protein